jgi:hypothetical protein
MAGAEVLSLVDDALGTRPIDTTSPEVIWLYKVRENRQPDLSGQEVGFPYLLFASGHVRYRGDARANLSYWDYANYAQVG